MNASMDRRSIRLAFAAAAGMALGSHVAAHPAGADASTFDGAWDVTLTCPPHSTGSHAEEPACSTT